MGDVFNKKAGEAISAGSDVYLDPSSPDAEVTKVQGSATKRLGVAEADAAPGDSNVVVRLD